MGKDELGSAGSWGHFAISLERILRGKETKDYGGRKQMPSSAMWLLPWTGGSCGKRDRTH